jgi:hypothetical protein
MVEVREDKGLKVNGLWERAKVVVEISWGKWLKKRTGGLRFLVTK